MNGALRAAAAGLAGLATLWFVPSTWCARDAGRWSGEDGALPRALAEGVGEWIDHGVDAERFSTGSKRYDGEWVFGTYVMAAMGLGQVALEHGAAPRDLERIDRCLDALISASGASADRDAWGVHALDDLEGEGHAAWLGYGGLAFATRERLAPGGRHADTLDHIVGGIRARLREGGPGGPETYPGERYPVDQASMVGTLGLWASARGVEQPSEIAAWTAGARERFVDPSTGLLRQAVSERGEAVDEPRGSGTFLASWFLSFVDPELSRDLYVAGRAELSGSILRFGMMREYPRGTFGLGDIDSGPVLLGYGISSTGFALGAARAQGDLDTFRAIYPTVHLFGAPRHGESAAGEDTLRFTTGGPLGDALLLAMLTARELP